MDATSWQSILAALRGNASDAGFPALAQARTSSHTLCSIKPKLGFFRVKFQFHHCSHEEKLWMWRPSYHNNNPKNSTTLSEGFEKYFSRACAEHCSGAGRGPRPQRLRRRRSGRRRRSRQKRYEGAPGLSLAPHLPVILMHAALKPLLALQTAVHMQMPAAVAAWLLDCCADAWAG